MKILDRVTEILIILISFPCLHLLPNDVKQVYRIPSLLEGEG